LNRYFHSIDQTTDIGLEKLLALVPQHSDLIVLFHKFHNLTAFLGGGIS